jgi:hypothetical protein
LIVGAAAFEHLLQLRQEFFIIFHSSFYNLVKCYKVPPSQKNNYSANLNSIKKPAVVMLRVEIYLPFF